MRLLLLFTAASVLAQTPARPLWVDVTGSVLGPTKYWTNKVEIADLNGDGRPDLLFANGGDYSTPGTPEPNQVFFNTGPGLRFQEVTTQVLGDMPDLARVIKARDLNADGFVDIIVGTTYQTQSRLFMGSGQGRFAEVTKTHLPAQPLSVGDLEPGDVDGDGDLDLMLADWGPGNNMSNEGGRTRPWLNDGTGRFTDATATRVHDRKSPSLATEWKRVVVEWTTPAGPREVPMRWYGENLWRAQWPANVDRAASYRACATDAAGNTSCGSPAP